MVIRLVVFDLDGTLVDTSGDLTIATNRLLARLAPGAPGLTREQVVSFVGNGARLLLRRAFAAAGVDEDADAMLPAFVEEYRLCMFDTSALYPGVIEVLDALEDRSLAVLTNKLGSLSRPLLEGLDVAGRFFRILGAGDGVERKPDPSGLRELMHQAGASEAETVLVGDSATDVKTGRAAGVLSVGVTYGFDPAGLADHPPDVLLSELRELPAVLAERAG